MNKQDERERALVIEGMRLGAQHPKDWASSIEAIERIGRETLDAIATVDKTYPRPATDAAAVRAECARVLRKASQVADDNGLRGLSGSLSRDADRIEAAHPQAEPVTDWRESYRRASAALDAARDAAAEPITGPYAHLYTREEALKLMRYSSYETTKAGTSVLDFPALLDATVKR